MSDSASAENVDMSTSPKGLNIQFARSTPDLPSPIARPASAFGSMTSRREPWRQHSHRPSGSLSTSLLRDLSQIQKELSWLARTENLKLSRDTGSPLMSPNLSSDPRRRSTLSDDSNDTFVDADEEFSLDESKLDATLATDEEFKVLGSECLRNAIIQRLAEIRGEETGRAQAEVALAFRQVLRDLAILWRAVWSVSVSKLRSVQVFIYSAISIAIFAWFIRLYFKSQLPLSSTYRQPQVQ